MSDALNPVSRREFGRRAAVAAAAAVPLAASGVDSPADAAQKEEKENRAEALRPPHELLVDVIRQKFPHEKLTPEMVDLIRADIAGDLGRSIAVEKFPLKNGDEPGFVFAAWRKEG